MRQRFLNMLALVGFFSFVGCAAEDVLSDDPSGDDELITFSAVQEGTATKAEISQSDSKVINWSTGDAITVYDGGGNSVRFGLTEGAGGTRASFSGKITQTAESYLALSPYQGGTFSDDGKIEFVTMKAKQTAVAGSFDPETALMVSKTAPGGTSMSFRNVVGYVKVTPQFDCEMISLISEDSSDLLAGTVSIDYNDGEPVVTVSDDGTNSVSISGDIVAGKTYYIAVLPGTLKSGFRLVFFAKDGKEAIKSTTNPLKIKRNTVANLGSVKLADLMVIPYVTFTAASEQAILVALAYGVTGFQYSVNNDPWQDIVRGKGKIVFGGTKGSFRLRGISPNGTTNNGSTSIIKFYNNVNVSCSGDIRTLVDYRNYLYANTDQARFSFLFENCTCLTSAPDLPAMTLADGCYSSMFSGCTGLTSAPELPATTLASDCYNSMFLDCTGLTSVPDLSATTLAEMCCYNMFSGCVGLTLAPDLPATTLASHCYISMFSGCTGLTSAPDLPATTLASHCYNSMFSGCTGLTSAPELPATTLAGGCYRLMFSGCTGLTSAPELPAMTLAGGCYSYMFSGCTGLTSAPELPATTLASSCYRNMFSGCTGLTSAPDLPATTLTGSCYRNMFSGCTGLTSAPDLPAMTLASYCYNSMFSGCTGLTSAPELPATTLASYCYNSMFSGCTGLTSAPVLPATNLSAKCYDSMFSGCTNLRLVRIEALKTYENALDNWLDQCAAKGIIRKPSALTLPSSAVPSGWSVVDYD